MFKHLDRMTSIKLKKMCQDEHIPGYSKKKKNQLVQHIKTHKINEIIKKGMDELLATQ